MKAVDTNILARLIVQDDAAQLAIADELVAAGVIVPITVLLVLGWLLRSRYGFDRPKVVAAMLGLVENPRIRINEITVVRRALQMFADGADFADAIHLVAAQGADGFATFDRDFPDGAAIGVPAEVVGDAHG